MESRKRGKKTFWAGLIVFALVFAGTFFGVQYFTKSGIFRVPGVVYYDESLNDEELDIIKKNKAYMVVNTTSNMNNAVGLPNVKAYLEHGLPVMVGNEEKTIKGSTGSLGRKDSRRNRRTYR